MEQLPDLNSLLLFMKVVELRSYSRAAEELKMQKSTVSRAITSLEVSLKRQLLYRTTRQIEPTPQGKEIYSQCHTNLTSLLQGLKLSLEHTTPMRGKIRIAAVQDIGVMLLSPLITEFCKLHPGLEMEMFFEDKVVDLVANAIDISVRAGKIEQQTFRGRKAGSVRFIFVASPSFLERIGREITIDNLKEQDFLSYEPIFQKGHCLFEKGNQSFKFSPKPKFQTASTLTLHKMTIAGAGISALPDFLCENELKQNRLIQVLKNWGTSPKQITVVTPARKDPSSTVSIFSEFLARKLSEKLG